MPNESEVTIARLLGATKFSLSLIHLQGVDSTTRQTDTVSELPKLSERATDLSPTKENGLIVEVPEESAEVMNVAEERVGTILPRDLD